MEPTCYGLKQDKQSYEKHQFKVGHIHCAPHIATDTCFISQLHIIIIIIIPVIY